MRRILLVMSVAALMAAMLVVTAVPAFATIHELARVPVDDPLVEEPGDEKSPVAGNFPPGLTDAEDTNPPVPEEVDGHENGSQNSDKLNSEGPSPLPCPRPGDDGGSCEGNFAQAIVSVGQNPSGGDSTNAFESSNPGNKAHEN